jgi:hypothetical protein
MNLNVLQYAVAPSGNATNMKNISFDGCIYCTCPSTLTTNERIWQLVEQVRIPFKGMIGNDFK